MRAAFAPLLLALALGASGCGEKDEPAPAKPEPAAVDRAPDRAPEAAPWDERPRGEPPARADRGASPALLSRRIVSSYIAALDRRDGAAVCGLFAPGALAELDLPRQGTSCAKSLDRSIGYRDPRGIPRFAGVELARFGAVQANPAAARVTATIVTRFADRDEPSIEDDLVYLERSGGRYRIAKPSAAIYRAIGAEPPPAAIAPPG